jgi:tetratricopeptide (TPR) repeat protein
MSLVNDVLRDLERNRLKEREIAQLVSAYKAPLENQPGMTGRRYLWPVIATLLVIAGYYSLRYYQSWQEEEFERLLSIAEPEHAAKLVVTEYSQEDEAHSEEVLQDLDLQQAELNEPEPQVEIRSQVITPAQVTAPINVTEPAQVIEPAKLEEPAPPESYSLIEKVESGEEFYQLALNAFRNQSYTDALSLLNKALAVQEKPHYVSLKARVYIELSDHSSFQQLQQQYASFDSKEWLQLMAAGYQQLDDYQRSNEFYLKLLAAEPKSIQWRLALAMNHQRMGNQQQALSQYQQLEQHPGLNIRQMQWVRQQLQLLQSASTNKMEA